MSTSYSTHQKNLLLALGLITSIMAGITAIIAGFGSKWGWWHFGSGFQILKYAVFAEIAAVLLLLLGFWKLYFKAHTPSKMAYFIATTLFISILAIVLSGIGTRGGLWPVHTGHYLLQLGEMGVVILLVGLFVRIVQSKPAAMATLTASILVLSVDIAAIALPSSWLLQAFNVPAIHDISTDMLDPPQFVAVLPLRKTASNPPEYLGGKISEQQQKAYPDIKPLFTSISAEQAFTRAVAIVAQLGWDLVGQQIDPGLIEATDTTYWFGFKDDIVIRISSQAYGSRLDIRSKSRVGGSDIGSNAKRIIDFMQKFNSASD